MELERSSGFLPRLESLRGLAAVSVVGYHVAAFYFQVIPTGLNAVVMFFVLSGFVLARSLQHDPSPAAFLLNRVYRLLPPAMATVLLFASLYWLFGYRLGDTDFSLVNVLLNALMIKSDINGVMWSMTVECAATPLILGSFWALARFGVTPLLIVCVVLFGLSFWGPYVHILGEHSNLAPLYGFVMGVLACCRGRDFLQSIPQSLQRALSVFAVIVMGVCAVWKQTAPVILLEVWGSAWIIASIAYGPPTAVFRPLDFAVVRFYGRISYSFYLLHPLGILLAIQCLSLLNFPLHIATVVLATMLAVLLTPPLAWLSWRAIEVPSKRLGRAQRELLLHPPLRQTSPPDRNLSPM